MYILTCNDKPVIASEDSDTLEEIIQKSIDSVLNNSKLDEQRHTEDEVWYYNGINHVHKKYEIKEIQVI